MGDESATGVGCAREFPRWRAGRTVPPAACAGVAAAARGLLVGALLASRASIVAGMMAVSCTSGQAVAGAPKDSCADAGPPRCLGGSEGSFARLNGAEMGESQCASALGACR